MERGTDTAQRASHDDESREGEWAGDAGHEPDYYAALGLQPDASAAEIRHAFRRLAKLWHPDRYTSAPESLRASAERRMRSLTRAYAVLGDAFERDAYNRRRGLPGSTAEPPSALWAAHDAYYPSGNASSHSQNLNGAGQFAGLMCLILAFSLLGRLLAGGLDGWQGALVTLLMLAFLLLAGLFFTNESPLAAKARGWAEGEPAGAGEPDWRGASVGAAHYESAGDDGLEAFETLVDEALASIPDDFKSWLENVVVQVEQTPSAETLRRAHVEEGHTLLGLYTGVPLTAAGTGRAGPEVVTIFRWPIERYCHGDPDLIRAQVRATVLHEIAHHFGVDHDEMPEWVK